MKRWRRSLRDRARRAACGLLPPLLLLLPSAPTTPRAAPAPPRKHVYVISKPQYPDDKDSVSLFINKLGRELEQMPNIEPRKDFLNDFSTAQAKYQRDPNTDVVSLGERVQESRVFYLVWIECKKPAVDRDRNTDAVAIAPCLDTRENCRGYIFKNLAEAVRRHQADCHENTLCDRKQ